MPPRPYLRRLAEKAGILSEYTDASGCHRITSDGVRADLLRAMGFDAAGEQAARRALERCNKEHGALRRLSREDHSPASRLPPRCWTYDQALATRRAVGLWANLYSLRSERNWGVGDMGDLEELARRSTEWGAQFVGVNPLHAVGYPAGQVSPYSPWSRCFGNVIYLDVTAIPEWPGGAGTEVVRSATSLSLLSRFRGTELIPYREIYAHKMKVMHRLHAEFVRRHGDRDTTRRSAYRSYLKEQGDLLREYATFITLYERLADTRDLVDWRRWPREYQDPHSPAVRRFREANFRDVDFQCYLQFELDRQWGQVALLMRKRGMTVGLFKDLALGVSPSSFDTWKFRDLFVTGASLGAPPDSHSRTGQNWNLSPINLWRLRAGNYGYWKQVLRSAFRHAGMVRIDHVMGLFRQFWIPRGRPATEGAYVRSPAKDLLAILAEESQRQRAIVIGEDLGTVPKGLAATLQRWGILSTRLLYFEKDSQGGFRPARRYHRNAMVMTNTHDHPPLAGFACGVDLRLRRRLNVIRSDAELRRALTKRAKEWARLLSRLAAEGVLECGEPVDDSRIVRAVYRFLARTPAPLIAVSLDDLAGETIPVNLPGLPQERYQSWTRRMRRPLDDILADPRVRTFMHELIRELRTNRKRCSTT